MHSGLFKTLYVNDLFIGIDQLGAVNSCWDYPMYWTKRVLFIPDCQSGLAMQSYCRAMYYKNIAKARAEVKATLELPTERLVLTHGPIMQSKQITQTLKGFLRWLIRD